MLSLAKTKRILLLSVILCCITIGVYAFFFHYINTVIKEAAKLQGKLADTEGLSEEIQSIQKILQDTEGDRNAIDSLFVNADAESEAAFVNSIEELATSSSLTHFETASLSHAPIAKNDSFEYLTMQASAVGTLPHVYNFLLQLESFPKALEVPAVQLEALPRDPKQKTSQWRLSFVIRVLKIK